MSNIEWTDATWNPVSGCTRVSPGCDHCYAVTMTHRLEGMERARRPRNGTEDGCSAKPGEKYTGLTVLNGRGDRHFNGVVRCHQDALSIPLMWKKPKRIFVNSMADLFHKDVPFEFIDKVFAVMALCPQDTFQVLTKRPERMAEYLGVTNRSACVADAVRVLRLNGWGNPIDDPTHLMKMGGFNLNRWPLPNVWLGTSVERQQEADERIPHLMKSPAGVRFLSCEPLLGPVDLNLKTIDDWDGPGLNTRVDWVIVGGESGPGARPCNVAWIRSIVKQCKAAGVPCFVKQLGRNIIVKNDSLSEWPDEGAGLMYFDEDGRMPRYQGEPMAVRTKHSKGGDMSEWLKDLRVREMPCLQSGGRA